MSVDTYLELEQYIKKIQDEIIQVFEQSPICDEKEKKTSDHHTTCNLNGTLQKDWNTGQYLVPYLGELLQLGNSNKTIDIGHNTSLSSDSKSSDDSCIETDLFYDSQKTRDNPLYLYETRTTNIVGTQTSPSQSSTNLTCWSDCSSPCMITTDEEVQDDTISLTSTDGNEENGYGYRNKNGSWQRELGTKSSSTPVLKRSASTVNKQARSQSDRHLSEIEAVEACKWLRAAGFPQYVQMYEDQQFPVDITAAQQDHPMLEQSVLNSLFRRLEVLNRCARVHQQKVTHTDDSEDEQCALSYNWTYQAEIRRWSRIDQNLDIPANIEQWQAGLNNAAEEPETSQQPSEHRVDRLRRMSTTRHRRKNRDGIVISDSGGSVLDYLSKQLSSLSTAESSSSHVSDSEYVVKYRKKKTRSLDKTDNLASYSPSHNAERFSFLSSAEKVEEGKLLLEEGGRPIVTLSCTQLQVLRKLALLKLTANMEKYCPTHRTGWNWDLPKLIRKMKTPGYREKLVFGVPLTVILQRTGASMPEGIEEALQWLQQNSYDQVGLFRKSGVKSRIQTLKQLIETKGGVNFSEYQAYDIADMIKQYFRELPEALLTNKLSETFILIFQHVPEDERRQAVLCALLLMPDEHCEVLLALLKFLMNIAEHSAVNQMNESNLAVCFAPSLFHYNVIPSSRQGLGAPHPREIAENKAAQECLLYLLKNCDSIFSIPKELLLQCTSNEMKETVVVQLSDLGAKNGGWRNYLQECQNMLLKEVREKGWISVQNYCAKVELAYKKVADGHPLRLWKVSAEIEAPPGEVLYRILKERPKWDDELQSTRTVAQIDKNAEIFQYTRRNIAPLPLEDYCIVRTWRTDLNKGACLIVETSIEHPDAISIPNSVRGIVLGSRYLIEPCGSGKSRLIHLSRVDTRGRMPEWYHKNYGHLCALLIGNIQNTFKQHAAGPESKV